MIENRCTRSDGRQEWLQLLEQAIVEDTRVGGRFVHVVFKDVPAGEDEVVQSRQRNELLTLRWAAVGALAESDGAHLGERSNGLGQAFANGFHASHECGS